MWNKKQIEGKKMPKAEILSALMIREIGFSIKISRKKVAKKSQTKKRNQTGLN